MSEIIRYIKPALIATGFLCGTVLWLWFLISQITTHGHTLRDAIQTIENDKTFQSQHAAISAMVQDTAETREKLAGYILKDEHDTIAFLSEMDQIANQNNVTLETSKLEIIESEGAFDQLAVTFVIEGSEEGVMHLITMLETLPYHGDVTSLSLEDTVDGETQVPTSKAVIGLQLSIQEYD